MLLYANNHTALTTNKIHLGWICYQALILPIIYADQPLSIRKGSYKHKLLPLSVNFIHLKAKKININKNDVIKRIEKLKNKSQICIINKNLNINKQSDRIEGNILSSKSTFITAGSNNEVAADQTSGSALFMQLFEADKNRLYAYIYAYVLDYSAADDIFQETSMTLWREFQKFESGSNFSKWANGIAFNRVRTFRQNQKKYKLGIDDDIVQELADVVAASDNDATAAPSKWWRLTHCSKRLSAPLKRIYQAFYIEELKAQEIADNSGRSIHAIRKSIHKLRKVLFDCVEQQVNED